MAPRLLAGDPRLPLLHDHGPEDDPRAPRYATRLRGRRGTPGDRADRSADDRVRHEGRDPRRTLRHVHRARGSCARRLGAPREIRRAASDAPSRGGCRVDGSGGIRRTRRRGRDPGAAGRGIGACCECRGWRHPRDHDRRLRRCRGDRRPDRPDDRTRRARRPSRRGRGAAGARSRRRERGRERRLARVLVGSDSRGDGRADRSPELPGRAHEAQPAPRCVPGTAHGRRRPRRNRRRIDPRPEHAPARRPRRSGVVPPHAGARPRRPALPHRGLDRWRDGTGTRHLPRPAPEDRSAAHASTTSPRRSV